MSHPLVHAALDAIVEAIVGDARSLEVNICFWPRFLHHMTQLPFEGPGITIDMGYCRDNMCLDGRKRGSMSVSLSSILRLTWAVAQITASHHPPGRVDEWFDRPGDLLRHEPVRLQREGAAILYSKMARSASRLPRPSDAPDRQRLTTT